MSRIAVVSSDGVQVDGHFGKADHFLIFDVNESGLTPVANRSCTPLSVNDPQHPFDPERFGALASVLADCQRVVVTHIGHRPAEELKARGIEVVIYEGPLSALKF